MSEAQPKTLGFLAAAKHQGINMNPFLMGTSEAREWLLGWAEFQRDSRDVLSDPRVQDYLRQKGRI